MLCARNFLQTKSQLLFKSSNKIVENIWCSSKWSSIHTTLPAPHMSKSTSHNFRESYFKKRDHIPDDYKLIYRAPMDITVSFSQFLSTFSLSTISLISLYKYFTNVEIIPKSNEQHVIFGMEQLFASTMDLYIFTGSFFALNLTILYAVSIYPLRIYRKNSHYLAMFESFIPMRSRCYEFKMGEINKKSSILPWHELTYRLRNKTILLLGSYFKTPSELTEMMRRSKTKQ